MSNDKKLTAMDRFKCFRGDVYKRGALLPEPEYETATGRRLYTVQQMQKCYEEGCKESAAEIERLTAELHEQARLNGMGSEREAALMAKVERLERELAALKTPEPAVSVAAK